MQILGFFFVHGISYRSTDLSLLKEFSKKISFKDFHNFIWTRLSRSRGSCIKWIYFWRVLFSTTVCYKKEGRRRRARDDGYERTDGRTDAALYYTCNTRSTTMATGWIKLGISKNFMIKSVWCSTFSIIVVFPLSWDLGLTYFWSFTQKNITNENINKQECASR